MKKMLVVILSLVLNVFLFSYAGAQGGKQALLKQIWSMKKDELPLTALFIGVAKNGTAYFSYYNENDNENEEGVFIVSKSGVKRVPVSVDSGIVAPDGTLFLLRRNWHYYIVNLVVDS